MNLIDTDARNPAEQRAKRRGFGFYASHLGRLSKGGYYMKRWILRLPFGFTIRLHCILRSDADRHLHDHPFDFTSFLLTSGYLETRPCSSCNGTRRTIQHVAITTITPCTACLDGREQRWWPRFSIVRKKAEDLHALTLPPGATAYTLVFAGPKRREWGFETEDGWCHNESYSARWPEHSSSTASKVTA